MSPGVLWVLSFRFSLTLHRGPAFSAKAHNPRSEALGFVPTLGPPDTARGISFCQALATHTLASPHFLRTASSEELSMGSGALTIGQKAQG